MTPTIKPIGVGDLKVVKQKLVRYAGGEVSHIENVLPREERMRVHRTLLQVEQTEEQELQSETESLRDVQSTERFEVQTETQRTAKSDTSFSAGLDLTASYGPVSLSASAKFASSNSKEESDKHSNKYAKDVTSRALERMVERTRTQRTSRRLEELREKNLHGLDNRESAEGFSGIYLWVDKFYRNKVVDYGKRLFYEFIVPEPAAFYLFAMFENAKTKDLPPEPIAPTSAEGLPLVPSDIGRDTYLTFLSQYGVEGAEPPPPEQLVIAKTFSRELASDFWAMSSDELKIPKGYTADFGSYLVWYTWSIGDDSPGLSAPLQIGRNRIEIGEYPSGLLFHGESDLVPFSATGYGIKTFALNVEASCTLMPDAYARWQLQIFDAVMAAYRRARSDYDDKVAASQLDGIAQLGKSPALNRQIEREELKRACIYLWSLEALGGGNGVSADPNATPPANYPNLDAGASKAMAEKAAFFEQAFEWQNLAYEFLPYFWGRKSTWADRQTIACTDPLFEQFLKAGAARVLVPVKPSQTERVLFYQMSGTIWSGGEIPALSPADDPEAMLYNAYILEMEGVPDSPDIDREEAIDESDETTWMSKVPTTLVWLHGGSELPDHEKK